MEQKLKVILGEYGWSVEFNRNLPLKLLAARSGLTEYGRNNIAYAKGLGSFAFLSAYYTDMPCEIDTWGEARRMALCDSCTKCVDNCPTGAIRADKRIIDGERCLTIHNEADSPVPFPDWITPSAHNSLVGCLACQIACPMNAKQLNNSAGVVEFDEAETELILGNTPPGILAKAMTEKLEFHGIDTYYEVLARNLKALFDKGLK